MTERDDQPLSSDEIARYQRHLVMAEIGGPGQARLRRARVLVVGAGGLGAPVIAALSGAGIGLLRIVDDDEVSVSNLHRQFIHTQPGLAKTESARRFSAALNPHVRVETRMERFGPANAAPCLEGISLALDCTDNAATRRVLAEACEAARIVLVSGAVNRFDGHVTVFAPHLADSDGRPLPRHVDLFPVDAPEGTLPVCAEVGVVGPVTALIGSLMALEAMKVCLGEGEPLYGRLLVYEGLAARFSQIRYLHAGA